MNDTRSRSGASPYAIAGVLVAVLLTVAFPPPVAGQSASAQASADFTTGQTSGTTTVRPGTNVTFTVRMTNASADSNSVALDVDLPEGWSVVDQSTDPNARFRDSAVEWLWFAPESPESTTFTVEYTVRVPSSAGEGSYAVDAQGNFNNGSFFWHNTTSTVTVDAGSSSDSSPPDTESPTATPTAEPTTAETTATAATATPRTGTPTATDGRTPTSATSPTDRTSTATPLPASTSEGAPGTQPTAASPTATPGQVGFGAAVAAVAIAAASLLALRRGGR